MLHLAYHNMEPYSSVRREDDPGTGPAYLHHSNETDKNLTKESNTTLNNGKINHISSKKQARLEKKKIRRKNKNIQNAAKENESRTDNLHDSTDTVTEIDYDIEFILNKSGCHVSSNRLIDSYKVVDFHGHLLT